MDFPHLTFNPWIGCSKVSAGCDNCYAETTANWRGWHDWQPGTPRKTLSDNYWRQPLNWNRRARAVGVPARVFCASLADVFDPQAPAGERERLWALIAVTPWLHWLLLTKRPRPMLGFLPCDPQHLVDEYPNIWLGVTAENQDAYDERWPLLARVNASVRFISYEPALGPVDLFGDDLGEPDWVICGGESGPGARPMAPEWARLMRDQCIGLWVPYFHKQWGTYASNPLVVSGCSEREAAELDPPANGKGGGLLDGRLWREFPGVAPPPGSGQLFALAAP